MAFEQRLSQSLKLSQKLVMTPQLQLAIKLLPMNTIQLQEAINQELSENPLLEEIDEPDKMDKPLENVTLDGEIKQSKENNEAMELDDFIQSSIDDGAQLDGNDSYGEMEDFSLPVEDKKSLDREKKNEELGLSNDYKIYEGGAGGDEEFERPIVYEESLQDHLLFQLNMMSKDEITKEIGAEIIGEINDEGYLDIPLEEITERVNQPLGKVLNVLKLIQTFDPSGVGARNLNECFLIQLESFHDMADLAAVLIADHLEELTPKNLKKLAGTLGCEMDEIVEAYNLIKSLDSKPGLNYSSKGGEYIDPEVTVVKSQGRYVAFLNNDDLPFLGVSDSYDNVLAAPTVKKDEKDFVQEKKKDALWFIKCIEQRKNTVLMVAQTIVDYQHEFFDKGIAYLRPMVLRDVADQIGMHESTISRVTTNKYMQTPLGVFDFKYFFHSRVDSHLGNEVSSLVVKELVKKLVSEEPKDKPLTDSDIVDELSKKDIKIARRTVAKYRGELKIPPTSKRKQYF